MLQDMSKNIEQQKDLWLKEELEKRVGYNVVNDPTKYQQLFTAKGYEVKTNGLEFLLVYQLEIISRFKPSLNFSL